MIQSPPETLQSIGNLLGGPPEKFELSITNKITVCNYTLILQTHYLFGISLFTCCNICRLPEEKCSTHPTVLTKHWIPGEMCLLYYKLFIVCDRDALAKVLYVRLFSWLVKWINQIINKTKQHSSIAVLDIFGFEVPHYLMCKLNI